MLGDTGGCSANHSLPYKPSDGYDSAGRLLLFRVHVAGYLTGAP
ncbi:hypothetical protein CEV33_0656 [Brucella grignonensis]|uniref:Uncharacterized protein n=1 Tax=Brucella grignonensis TaxID=94627 RepID=A0A256FG62_9HYPH|nr:hypothetical protein CEV33_0656 [Brucella grignonensis]